MSAPDDLYLLTREDVARRLGCSERTVDKLREAGQLEAVKLGSRVRITGKSLASYIASLPAA